MRKTRYYIGIDRIDPRFPEEAGAVVVCKFGPDGNIEFVESESSNKPEKLYYWLYKFKDQYKDAELWETKS